MASNVKLSPYLYDDAVIPGSASGVAVITKGDWGIWSASWVIAAHDATIGSPAYRTSAAGVALENNPSYDSQGVAINNSGLTFARRGIFRFSGANSATAGTIPVGSYVYPDTTASGIVGQTGRTGVGPLWATAAPVGISASIATAEIASGIGILINQVNGGDATAIQYDVAVNLASNVGYF